MFDGQQTQTQTQTQTQPESIRLRRRYWHGTHTTARSFLSTRYDKSMLLHHAQLHVSNVVRRQPICTKSQQRNSFKPLHRWLNRISWNVAGHTEFDSYLLVPVSSQKHGSSESGLKDALSYQKSAASSDMDIAIFSYENSTTPNDVTPRHEANE
jgi:hypothetical protein